MNWRAILEGWIAGMDWRDGLEGQIGGIDFRDGLDGLEGWIKEMDWRDSQRDRQIKGWRDVVLLYLFYFREKRNFRIFVKYPFSRKAKFFAFSQAIFAKNENDFRSYFRENFAKIYFHPNSKRDIFTKIRRGKFRTSENLETNSPSHPIFTFLYQ